MRVRPNQLILILFLICALFCGCAKTQVTTLNSVCTFYSDNTLIEATARELTIQGSDAEVRIRMLNFGEESANFINAQVDFLDEAGNVLYSDQIIDEYDTPLAPGESVGVTATCSGKDADKIKGIAVSALVQ